MNTRNTTLIGIGVEVYINAMQCMVMCARNATQCYTA